jgi:glucose-1-phosphate thymidylyltransferase
MQAPLDKAVILARGLGTRMRRADAAAPLDDSQAAVADTGVKALIPIDRPFLDYVLSALADAGYRHVCLVVGPEQQSLRDYYTRQVEPQRLSIELAVQEEPKGTADAVAAAESFADGGPFLSINSDNYYPLEAYKALGRQDGPAVALFHKDAMLAESNVTVERLNKFAFGEIDKQGFLKQIVEKPDQREWAALSQPDWISMNCWRFGPTIFRACRSIGPSPRGEYEIPDAVRYAMENLGERFRAVPIRSPVLDLSSREDIAPVAAKLSHAEVKL